MVVFKEMAFKSSFCCAILKIFYGIDNYIFLVNQNLIYIISKSFVTYLPFCLISANFVNVLCYTISNQDWYRSSLNRIHNIYKSLGLISNAM